MKFYHKISIVVLACNLAYGMSIANNPYQYAGEYRDNESNLDYLSARYYNPDLMRFTSRDTYDLLNLYAYGNSDPIMKEDPSGHNALDIAETILTFGANKYLPNNQKNGLKESEAIILGAVLWGALFNATSICAFNKVEYNGKIMKGENIISETKVDSKNENSPRSFSSTDSEISQKNSPELSDSLDILSNLDISKNSPFTHTESKEMISAGVDDMGGILKNKGGMGDNLEHVNPEYQSSVKNITNLYGRGQNFKREDYLNSVLRHTDKLPFSEQGKTATLFLWVQWFEI